MKILDEYFKLEKQVHDYFGYAEDWVAIPLDDCRKMYWHLTGEDHGHSVKYAREKEHVFDGTMDDGYSDEIYTQRFLPKWVCRGKDYTMVCCNPGVDGNKFLRVFDNSREVKANK